MKAIILMGISGSGKSTYAKRLNGVVVSADDFFMVDGEYRFDPAKLSEAHGACFRSFLAALVDDKPLIVVDNTNTTAVEIAPYILAAQAFGAEPKVVYVHCPVEVAVARGKHGVPEHTIAAMAKRIEATIKSLPPWWAFGEAA